MTDHLTCADALERVEPIAAGDLVVDADARAHFETCPRCASALASARRIEAALAARETPSAPPKFTAAVAARIRRERWRTEQRIDRVFNIAVAVAILLVVGGVAALLNVSNVLSAAAAAWDLAWVATNERVEVAGTSLTTYVAAAAFMASALAMWWWAERRLSL
jgi:anti-sigma factor RsiW